MLVTGGAGYIGSHAVKALAAQGTHVVVYDDLSAGHREAARPRVRSRRGRHPRLGAPASRDARASRRRRDALRRLARRSAIRCAIRPATTGTTSSGALSVLDAMVAEQRAPFSCFPRRAPSSAILSRRRSPNRIRSSRSTPTARRSCRSSARCRTTRRRTGSGRSRCGISMPREPIRTGSSARITRPEIHIIPRAIDAALGRDSFQVFGDDYDTPDGTCLRDYVHVNDLAAAHLLALGALRRRRRVHAVQPGQRPSDLGQGRPRLGRAGRRPESAVHAWARGGRAIRRSSSRRASASDASWAGRRSSRTSTSSSKRRGAGASRTRTDTHGRPPPDVAVEGAAGRSAALGRDARLQRAGHDRGDDPAGARRPDPHRADRRGRRVEGRDARHPVAGWRQSCRSSSCCSRPTRARGRRCGAGSRR